MSAAVLGAKSSPHGGGRGRSSSRNEGGSHFSSRLRWLVGIALLAAVVAGVFHFSEGKKILNLLFRVHPGWLAGAVALQALTYPLQGFIWMAVSHAAGSRLSLWLATQLSLAKLFVDQALPSAGISGTVLVGGVLGRRGVHHAAVMAMVAVNLVSFYTAYVLGAAVALAVAFFHGWTHPAVLIASVVFSLFAGTMGVVIVSLPGRREGKWARKAAWIKPLAKGMELLRQADPKLVRDARLQSIGVACQGAILALDAATVWVFIHALGGDMAAMDVFACVMVATLFRTVGISPGGLGTYEAASVMALKAAGASFAVALSATLLYRGLSYWLPMLPGFWLSRRLAGGRR